jgi:pSer/pThr/pTyr-binding forkhead associated (FHA) protein
MARLLRNDGAGDTEVLELNLGVNHFGRDPENHFPVNHPTVSSRHCELVLTADGVLLRDLGSTNGTFINGALVKSAVLQPGQMLRLGDVEFVVDTTDAHIAIPEIERPIPAPPVVLPDGVMLCQRHAGAKVTHRCTHCQSILCDACVTRLRRKGGKTLKLCKLCSHPVELLPTEKPKKKSFLSKLTSTIKLPFLRGKKESKESKEA